MADDKRCETNSNHQPHWWETLTPTIKSYWCDGKGKTS